MNHSVKMDFASLHNQLFNNFRESAHFFYVQPVTVKRWVNGTVPVNPLAERLLLMKYSGYLPVDSRWDGFKIDEQRAVFITPEKREFSPRELLSFSLWRDEYKQLVERHGHIESPIYYPAHPNPYPFRGGRRNAAPWFPSKLKR